MTQQSSGGYFLRNGIHILALCVFASLPALAASYNAHTDFGGTNPSGAWAYGYAGSGALATLDSSFTSMPSYVPNCDGGGGFTANCWGGVSSSLASPTGTFNSGTVNFSAGYLNMHP